MANYLTSAGIQQVSLTIASGSLTGTATINAVGAGAFMRHQGSNPTDTAAQLDDTEARITLTNSTTITATRGITGASKAITINCVVVDGDTTNLIKTVQYGTITVTNPATSNTASISTVTNNNTEIVWLGQSYAGSVTNSDEEATLSLSGTTVTANCTNAPAAGSPVTISFCVIEYQGTALASAVQNIAYSATHTGSSDTITITSVNTANTMLGWGGFHVNTGTNPANWQMYASLTNSTTITLTWNTSSTVLKKVNLCVVEFATGVLNQPVQRGTISLSAATSNTATITSSSASNGFVNWLNNSTNSTTIKPEVGDYRITQTNATTLTMSSDGAATGVGSYEVIEFPANSSAVHPWWLYATQQIIGNPDV